MAAYQEYKPYRIAPQRHLLAIEGYGRMKVKQQSWIWPGQRVTPFLTKQVDYVLDVMATTEDWIGVRVVVQLTAAPDSDDTEAVREFIKFYSLNTNPSEKLRNSVHEILYTDTRAAASTFPFEVFNRNTVPARNKIFAEVQEAIKHYGLKVHDLYLASVTEVQLKTSEGTAEQAAPRVRDGYTKEKIAKSKREEADAETYLNEKRLEAAKIEAETAEIEAETAEIEAETAKIKAEVRKEAAKSYKECIKILLDSVNGDESKLLTCMEAIELLGGRAKARDSGKSAVGSQDSVNGSDDDSEDSRASNPDDRLLEKLSGMIKRALK